MLGTVVLWSIPRTAYGRHFRCSHAVLQLCGHSLGHWDRRAYQFGSSLVWPHRWRGAQPARDIEFGVCCSGIGMSDLACGFGEAGWHTGGDLDLPDGQHQ